MDEDHVDSVMSLSEEIEGLSTRAEETDERHGHSPYSPRANMSITDDDGHSGAANERDNKRRRSKPKNDNRRRVYVTSSGMGDSIEVSSQLLLPDSRVGGVIGRGGDVIKSIREMSGARINIAAAGSDDRDPQFRLVTVSGLSGAVCHAVQMVAAQAGLFDSLPRGGRRRDSNVSQSDGEDAQGPSSPQEQLEPGLRLVIDAGAAGQLIGKKGSTISEIRMQSGARIQVVGEEESAEEGGMPDERVVLVLGSTEPCLMAHKLITSVLAAEPGTATQALHNSMLPPAYQSNLHHHGGFMGNTRNTGAPPAEDDMEESCQVVMRVSNDKVGRVIGKGGSTINEIRQESQCKIDIENSQPGGTPMRVIRIRGNMQQTQVAQQLITQMMTAA